MANVTPSTMSSVTELMVNTTTHIYDTYSVNILDHWKQFPLVPDSWHYFIGCYITIVGLSGVCGNLLVIYMFSTVKNLRTPSNMFVVNLALSDCAFSAINGFPLLTISAFNTKWLWGNTACVLYGFSGAIFGIMSIFTLAAISYDRFVVISNPLQAAKSMTKRRAFIVIIMVWVASLIVTLPPIFGWGGYVPEGFQTSCTFDYLTRTPHMRAYMVFLYVIGYALPLLIICACYALILRAVRKHAQEMVKMAKKLNASDIKANQDKHNQEFKIAKIAMMLIFLFILSWTPYATVALIAQFGPAEWVTPYVSEFPVMLAKASAMHNPLVYAMSHPRFREALSKKFPWLLCCCKFNEKETSTAPKHSTARQKVSRTVSANSGIGNENASDVSSVISNLDSEAPCPPMEMQRTGGKSKETSFTHTAASMRNPDGSYTNQLVDNSGDMVRNLIGALMTVAGGRNGAAQKTNNTGNEDVFIVDGGQQIDLKKLAQVLAASGGLTDAGSTITNNLNSPGKAKAEQQKKEADNDSAQKELLANEEGNAV